MRIDTSSGSLFDTLVAAGGLTVLGLVGLFILAFA